MNLQYVSRQKELEIIILFAIHCWPKCLYTTQGYKCLICHSFSFLNSCFLLPFFEFLFLLPLFYDFPDPIRISHVILTALHLQTSWSLLRVYILTLLPSNSFGYFNVQANSSIDPLISLKSLSSTSSSSIFILVISEILPILLY